MTPPTRLCVFCGSNHGDRPAFRQAAQRLGETLVRERIGLVYGGAKVGLMGVIADAVLAAGGEVIGVMPTALRRREIQHDGLTTLHQVDSMHERKALMAELSSGFIALPGGIGTLEELFEVWSWNQLGLHRKPCALLNVEGFFDPLIEFLDLVCRRQFMPPEHRAMLISGTEPEEILRAMFAYEPPDVSKWIDRSQT